MKEIVINTSFGGFSLSEEAVEWMRDHGVEHVDAYTFCDADKRDDPLLVQCVKELGEIANGGYAELKVIEYDAGKERLDRIDEYDGVETPVFSPLIRENDIRDFVDAHDADGLISYLSEGGIEIETAEKNITKDAEDNFNIPESGAPELIHQLYGEEHNEEDADKAPIDKAIVILNQNMTSVLREKLLPEIKQQAAEGHLAPLPFYGVKDVRDFICDIMVKENVCDGIEAVGIYDASFYGLSYDAENEKLQAEFVLNPDGQGWGIRCQPEIDVPKETMLPIIEDINKKSVECAVRERLNGWDSIAGSGIVEYVSPSEGIDSYEVHTGILEPDDKGVYNFEPEEEFVATEEYGITFPDEYTVVINGKRWDIADVYIDDRLMQTTEEDIGNDTDMSDNEYADGPFEEMDEEMDFDESDIDNDFEER